MLGKSRCNRRKGVAGSEGTATGVSLLTTDWADLYRPALPAAHAARLPAHLLWRLLEGVVRIPGLDCDIDSPVHLPLMSCLGADHTAECHGHDTAGYIFEGEPG